MALLITHYYPDDDGPACNTTIDPSDTTMPAESPEKTNCVDCCFVMITDNTSDDFREMERWIKRFQELRKHDQYYEQKQKQMALIEQMRTAPLHVPKSRQIHGDFRPDSDTRIPMRAFGGDSRFRRQMPVVPYPFRSNAKRIEWAQFLSECAEFRYGMAVFMQTMPIAVDLWYDAEQGETCTLRTLAIGFFSGNHVCGRPAIEVSTNQFGLPIARCDGSHVPVDHPYQSLHNWNDYTKRPDPAHLADNEKYQLLLDSVRTRNEWIAEMAELMGIGLGPVGVGI